MRTRDNKIRKYGFIGLAAIGTAALIYVLSKKNRTDYMGIKVNSDNTCTDDSEDNDSDKVIRNVLDEEESYERTVSPRERYDRLVNEIMEDNLFGKEDIIPEGTCIDNYDKFTLIYFNKNSTELIFSTKDTLFSNGYDRTMDTIRNYLEKISVELSIDRVKYALRQISFMPSVKDYKSFKDLEKIDGHRMISLRLYNCDEIFISKMLTLIHPNGGEEDDYLDFMPMGFMDPDVKSEKPKVRKFVFPQQDN